MKPMPILIALALIQPVAASAQSVSDTHVLVWHPTGKTPTATYRPRDESPCAKRFKKDRPGKELDRHEPRCPVARTPWAKVPAN
ncbi:hypothetical protein FPZ24_15105 [Sphingomonas panacisoli]|uniref:Uncharacterized protein n=1 Tax=Sphingomonas panacisoli TaxID=1813879 RepID=A0A5B8LNH5_9SPHN|nr:hypothetical protein [Sphingomonas panacisoli]QDZ08630.1 hypothetical protein FPZ24_15105 [Sphingomonas panacisoli]